MGGKHAGIGCPAGREHLPGARATQAACVAVVDASSFENVVWECDTGSSDLATFFSYHSCPHWSVR